MWFGGLAWYVVLLLSAQLTTRHTEIAKFLFSHRSKEVSRFWLMPCQPPTQAGINPCSTGTTLFETKFCKMAKPRGRVKQLMEHYTTLHNSYKGGGGFIFISSIEGCLFYIIEWWKQSAEELYKVCCHLFAIYIEVYVNTYQFINSYEYKGVPGKMTSKLLTVGTPGNRYEVGFTFSFVFLWVVWTFAEECNFLGSLW